MIGGWIGAKFALAALAGVLAAAMVWVAVVRLRLPLAAALVTVLAFAAGAPLAMYATQVYPEIAAALAVTLAIAALLGPLRHRALAGAGVCIVALPWLSVKYAPIAATLALLAVWLYWRAGDRRAVYWFGGALAVAGVVFAGLHQAWYGGWTAYASGDHFVGGEMTVVGNDPDYAGRAIRLVGLLIDRGFGLATWNPLYLLAIPALAYFVVRRPERWPVLVAPLVVGWLNATFVALTMQGWWWPGRQVVVVLPCVVFAVAWWAASNRYVLRAVAVLGVVGAFIFMWLVVESSVGDLRLIVTFESTSNPLVQAWRHRHARLPHTNDARLDPARRVARRDRRDGARRHPAASLSSPYSNRPRPAGTRSVAVKKRWLAGLAVGMLVLAACGDDDGGSVRDTSECVRQRVGVGFRIRVGIRLRVRVGRRGRRARPTVPRVRRPASRAPPSPVRPTTSSSIPR